MGVDDSVTGGRKREGKTLMEGDTSSPARHTRAATKEDREMGVDDAVTVGRKREGKTSMEGDTISPLTIRKKRKLKDVDRIDYEDQWDRIYYVPTIASKYTTLRCNLNNSIREQYKGESLGSECLCILFVLTSVLSN